MPLRAAIPADIQALAELWDQAFPGERTISERARQLELGIPYGGIESVWVLEDAGRLVGTFKALRFREYIAAAPLAMLGLAAVAVATDARRRGLGRRLCQDAIRVGRERGDLVSALYPFRPDFYHALGWGLTGELHEFCFRADALPDAPARRHVRAATAADRAAIADCYARVAARSNGPIARAERAWDHHLGQTRACVYDDGRTRGYLLARYGRDRAPEARTLHIHELLAEDDVAYGGLLAWIACQRDQWPRVRYQARAAELLALRLRDPRPPGYRPARRLWFPTARVLRGPMIRVLDVAGALAARTRWGERDHALTLRIEVQDAEVPENRGPWILEIERTGAHVRRAQGTARAHAGLATDAATFAQIYAGELLPSAAARLGRAQIEGAADAIDRAFRVHEPFWLLDEF